MISFAGLIARVQNYLLRREPGVVYTDKSGSIVGMYGRQRDNPHQTSRARNPGSREYTRSLHL